MIPKASEWVLGLGCAKQRRWRTPPLGVGCCRDFHIGLDRAFHVSLARGALVILITLSELATSIAEKDRKSTIEMVSRIPQTNELKARL